MSETLDRIRLVADELLFAAALEVDRSGVVPPSHWDRLAAEGLYGLAAPPESGGLGLELPEVTAALEAMAGGCLATTFTWIQHHGVVRSLAASTNGELRTQLLPELVSGRTRAGVTFAGAIPDPPRMTCARADGGWLVSGDAPFVSGWGIVDVLQVSAAEVATHDVVGGLVDAREQPGITSVTRLPLVAADASNTVTLRLDALFVPDDRVVGRITRPEFLAGQTVGARINASLPLGLVVRCVALLEDAGRPEIAKRFGTECDAVRGRLDAALGAPETMPAVRAEANELALRAAAALVTAGGGPSLLRTQHAQRLVREATFTLVAASRPQLKDELLDRLAPG